MRIFIDSANLLDVKEALSWGVVSGITTNPSLIKKEVDRLSSHGSIVDFESHIRDLLLLAGPERPVSLEVTASDASSMFEQGRLLFQKFNSVANNVVIKVPVSTYTGDSSGSDSYFEGLKAIKSLSDAGIPVNATLIFTPEQALLAALAGASFVSPFAGRVDDYIRSSNGIDFSKSDYFPEQGWPAVTSDSDSSDSVDESGDDVLDDNGIVSGVDLVAKIVSIFEFHDFNCEVLAASIRNARQARECALAGADVATIPFSVLREMVSHFKTREGFINFSRDVVPEYESLFK